MVTVTSVFWWDGVRWCVCDLELVCKVCVGLEVGECEDVMWLGMRVTLSIRARVMLRMRAVNEHKA